MHDWTLTAISLNWGGACAKIQFLDSESQERFLEVKGLAFINIPKKKPWGESVSVNEVLRRVNTKGNVCMSIEMQSGDIIELEAEYVNLF